MSAPQPDPYAPKPRPAIRTAASVLLVDAHGRVLVGRRNPRLPFMGGFQAFPGGALEPGDGEGLAGAHAAAMRELEEETGLQLDVPPSEPVICWTTPDTSPIRFATWFFLEQAPEGDLRSCGELLDLRYEAPEQMLEAYRSRRSMMAPPTRYLLEALLDLPRGDVTVWREEVAARVALAPEPSDKLEPVWGIRQLPLRTPTLPPATHTNCLVVGHERLILVDPATYDDRERERFAQRVVEIGAPVEAVVLTHHHRDHVGSAQWCADRFDAPIWAHHITADLLPEMSIDRHLAEGDIIDLGSDADGVPFRLDVLYTPGHAPGHVVLRDLRPGLGPWIVGDMVASIGTIIVDPDEGDMGEYIRQLERMRSLSPGPLFPAHGGPIGDPDAKLEHYLKHRLMREEKVLAAVMAHGVPAAAAELLPRAYDDTPRKVWPLAERSCLAHLLKLVDDGRIRRTGDRFSA